MSDRLLGARVPGLLATDPSKEPDAGWLRGNDVESVLPGTNLCAKSLGYRS